MRPFDFNITIGARHEMNYSIQNYLENLNSINTIITSGISSAQRHANGIFENFRDLGYYNENKLSCVAALTKELSN